jgi:hypothetical protein
MTRFKTAQGQRAMGTAELLESSGAVKASAVQQLNAIAEEFDQQMQELDARGDEVVQGVQGEVAAERTAAVEDFARRCQGVIAREGELHAASIAPVVRQACRCNLSLLSRSKNCASFGWTEQKYS